MLDLSCKHAQRLLRSVFPWWPTWAYSHEYHRCKEKWEREILSTDSRVSTPFYFDLDQTMVLPAHAVFRILACILDFYPFDILDVSVFRCLKCKPMWLSSSFFIHHILRAQGLIDQCLSCCVMMDAHGWLLYRLFVQLQGQNGSKLVTSLVAKDVYILHKWSEGETDKILHQCLLLRTNDPTNFHSNLSAFDRLLVAVDPILGNLREIHEFWSKNEHRETETLLMVFTIESWVVCEEKAFDLLEYVPVWHFCIA